MPLSPAPSLHLAAKLHHIFLGLQSEHFPVIPCKLGNAHVPLLRQLLDRKGVTEIFLDPAVYLVDFSGLLNVDDTLQKLAADRRCYMGVSRRRHPAVKTAVRDPLCKIPVQIQQNVYIKTVRLRQIGFSLSGKIHRYAGKLRFISAFCQRQGADHFTQFFKFVSHTATRSVSLCCFVVPPAIISESVYFHINSIIQNN